MMLKEKLTADTFSMLRAIEDKGFALKLYLRLKEYESTDLTPEDILRMKLEIFKMERELNRLQTLINCFADRGF